MRLEAPDIAAVPQAAELDAAVDTSAGGEPGTTHLSTFESAAPPKKSPARGIKQGLLGLTVLFVGGLIAQSLSMGKTVPPQYELVLFDQAGTGAGLKLVAFGESNTNITKVTFDGQSFGAQCAVNPEAGIPIRITFSQYSKMENVRLSLHFVLDIHQQKHETFNKRHKATMTVRGKTLLETNQMREEKPFNRDLMGFVEKLTGGLPPAKP